MFMRGITGIASVAIVVGFFAAAMSASPASSTPPSSVSDLRVESATIPPGASVVINVTADATNLGSYRIDVQYDSVLVVATECTSSNGVCSIDVVAPETVRLNGSNLAGITGENVVLGTITFLSNGPEGTAALTVNESTLVLQDTVGATPNVTPTNGAITIDATAGQAVVWGDSNCKDGVNPVDSLFVLRGDAGLPTDTGDCPDMGQSIEVLLASPHIWGDVDCAGGMSPVDSLKVLRFDAGLSVSQEDGCPLLGSQVLVTE